MRKHNIFISSFIISLLTLITIRGSAQTNYHTLHGRVTDFDGNAIDSAMVLVKDANFDDKYTTFSDEEGYYELEVEEGQYASIASVRMQDYGKTHLEYWAWNVNIDDDMNLPIRYDKLEIYGVNVFKVQGAYPGYTIYLRPMALSRYIEGAKKGVKADMAPAKDELEIKIIINDEEVKINSMQSVKEYVGGDFLTAYLIHTDLEKNTSKKPTVFHIIAKDKKYGDMGEAHYFMKQ